MNGNFNENQYLQYVIKKLEQHRNQSVDCFSKTDIYDEGEKKYILEWFDMILEKIRQKPPKRKISSLIVFDSIILSDIQIDYNTVAENISLSENGDAGKIEKILSELDLAGFISRLPNGLGTYVGRSFSDEGIDPSGGEGQKLAIAKAMYKDSPILILDEPTASLDPLAESEIYEQFFKLSASKTTIFISHRLAASTIADRIVVFDKGKIVESGTHRELMRNGGLYEKMYIKQRNLVLSNRTAKD